MNEDKMIFQDSYTEKLDKGTLKVYLDLNNPKQSEIKLKTFFLVKALINQLRYTAPEVLYDDIKKYKDELENENKKLHK